MVGAASFTLRYSNVRILMALLALLPAVMGFALQVGLPAGRFQALKTVAVCLSLGYCATCALSFQLPAQNAGGFTKRTTVTSMGFLGYSLGNIVGPHVFYDGQHPRYLTGYVCDIASFVIQAVLLIYLRSWYIREVSRWLGVVGCGATDLMVARIGGGMSYMGRLSWRRMMRRRI
jgi:hypothetical protein